MSIYKEYFGFIKEPFSNEIQEKNIFILPELPGIKERIEYIINIGGIMVLTGDVGTGKSTSIRWVISSFHPSEIILVNLIGSSGSLAEFYKQLSWSLSLNIKGMGNSIFVKSIKSTISEMVSRKMKIVIIIDEAHLLRQDFFSEIHTLTQFNNDSKNFISIVLAGQVSLLDKLSYRTSVSLASRVVTRVHLNGISRDKMKEYIDHHIHYSGLKISPYSESAITAIHQGSGGYLRKANHLAKGGLIVASKLKLDMVDAEHIRIAATELII